MFQFQGGLSVDDTGSTMKIGTDAVWLTSETIIEGAKQILDIGTGSGVVALLLAQKITTPFHIDTIDIDASACEQAQSNILEARRGKQISVYHTALQDYFPNKKYDLIVSNPPFFEPTGQANNAHHTITLTHSELLKHCVRLLTPLGACEIILPYEQVYNTLYLAQQVGLYPERLLRVYTDPIQRTPKRIIIRLTRQFRGGSFTIEDRH